MPYPWQVPGIEDMMALQEAEGQPTESDLWALWQKMQGPEIPVPQAQTMPAPNGWQNMGSAFAQIAPYQDRPYESGASAFFRALATGAARGYGGAVMNQRQAQGQELQAKNEQAMRQYQADEARRREGAMYGFTTMAKALNSKPASARVRPITPDIARAANDQGIKVPASWIGDDISLHPELKGVYMKTPPKDTGGSFFGLPGGAMDPDAVADGVYEGKIAPADVNTRSVFGAAVLSALRRRHPDFDKKNADVSWRALSQLTSTQNQNRMTALRQSIASTRMHLKRARQLNDALDKAGVPRGSVQEANRFSLAAAVRGAYGPEVAVLASQFSAQVPLMQSDFATVFSNGFAPTEDSYKLAQKMIRLDLPSRQVAGNLDNIDKDIQFKGTALDQLAPMEPGKSGIIEQPPPVAAPKMVKMKAPNGKVREVPEAQVEHYKSLGAKVVN